MATVNNPAKFSLSAAIASGAGAVLDTRHCGAHGYLMYVTTGGSANIALQVSHDGTGWMQHSLYTAIITTGTAQISDYLPYVRVNVNVRYAGATAWAFYQPLC